MKFTIIVNGTERAAASAADRSLLEVLRDDLGGYRVPRRPDLPEFEVVLIDRPDQPSAGAGEAPIVAVAPAIGNAIFHACGVRLRSMPLAPGGVVRAAR